ncbi:MAG: hypothetical protein HN909_08975, partial [Phycisphaerales bacterium]|nr:hypothetical protein [Phycisphaerales bacterium]
ELILDSDQIYCLATRHLETVEPIAALGGVECALLGEQDISDPYGGDLDLYRAIAQEIHSTIAARITDGNL